MTTTILTGATFEATVTENPVVLVDFWAAWCGNGSHAEGVHAVDGIDLALPSFRSHL